VVDHQLLQMLRSVTIPAAMVESRKFVDYLTKHAEADTHSGTAQEGLQYLNDVLGLMIASQLEVLNALGEVDEQLRNAGQRLKALEGR